MAAEDVDYKYRQGEDQGERRPRHRIEAFKDGAQIGHLEWHGTTHRITSVEVEEEHGHQGVASEMWKRSQEIRPKAQHSADRTKMGDNWARKVGGTRPRSARYGS